jgi:hypothetical protein
MKVLVPQHKEERFITEVIKSYTAFCEVNRSYDTFWLNKGTYDIIHLHWPEYLFKWQVPTDLELLLLERVLQEWHAKGAKIVVTRHNYLPHRPQPERYIPLYNLIYTMADAVIHLGKYSETEYLERYKAIITKTQIQAQIPHPLFTNYPNKVNRNKARAYLKIKPTAKVMLVFGAIRTVAEKNLVLQAFEAIEEHHKVLLAPGWRFSETKEPVNQLKWLKVKKSKKYRITQEFIADDQVQYYFKAADFVFLPRIDTLNSGIPFLATVFNTPMLGCQTGNITEVLKANRMPNFGFGSNYELTEAIRKVDKLDNKIQHYDNISKTSLALDIGKEHFKFFKSLK